MEICHCMKLKANYCTEKDVSTVYMFNCDGPGCDNELKYKICYCLLYISHFGFSIKTITDKSTLMKISYILNDLW